MRLTHSMPEAWTAEEIVEPEHVTIESEGGLVIHADLFVPRGLDTSREHPGLVYVHGGPIRQMRRGWHPMRPYSVFYSFNQLLLQRGYVVISVDYRGGTGYGVEYERANFHQMARADMEDCVAAARHLAALPYVDERRIGIWGLSYGGYMTLACLTKRPDVFAMGINIAGLWDTKQWAEWVAEKAPGPGNMLAARAGLVGPLADADALRESSPRNFVEGLRRPLLNLHGTADGNVDFAQLDRIVEDCTAHGKDFAALYYPGETHMFTKRETWRDAFGRMLDAFDRYLKCDPDERPRAMI
ncbi:MAG: S9 family peptidase [Dactylosporangium sp.]|nr:S9 family peptidase [Dactylosporangium sp.]